MNGRNQTRAWTDRAVSEFLDAESKRISQVVNFLEDTKLFNSEVSMFFLGALSAIVRLHAPDLFNLPVNPDLQEIDAIAKQRLIDAGFPMPTEAK